MKRLSWLAFGLVLSVSTYAQIKLQGRVLDENLRPLIGANVKWTRSGLGVSSDQGGYFQINKSTAQEDSLMVTFIGYRDQIIASTEFSENDISVQMEINPWIGESVFVYATRANEQTPTTYSNYSKDELEARNLGQDLPVLLNFTPSIVTTSDAGAGVGYTGMRIRGSDGTRINVTVNGVPINDSESHGVFWVNMPDLASSVDNIQIQRGVGTSTNGAAAFGATVNLQTNRVAQEAYAQLENTIGSFNTVKNTLILNTGLLNDKFNFEGRLSRIVSDGYIDRSAADLKSFYFSGGYFDKKTTVKLLAFGGREITQQAWYGTPQARLEGDIEGVEEVIAWSGEYNTPMQIDNLRNSDRRFNYYLYDNEVDNYGQDHYQLHLNHSFTEYLSLSGSLHYTYGRGYFEQYRESDEFGDYGLSNLIIGDSVLTTTNLIRRRWLDNDFYGFIAALNYNQDRISLTAGGGWNQYNGDHFGEIIWSQFAHSTSIRDRYYDGSSNKTDGNFYMKGNVQLTDQLYWFGDAQLRWIDYKTAGVDNDLTTYDAGDDYLFFNPKTGITYHLTPSSQLYGSVAIGQREPVRNDFIDALDGAIPSAEKMVDYELGVRGRIKQVDFQANLFYMDYTNQLVLTGALNDVGSAIRTNVPDSYRAGIELSGRWQINELLSWNANFTWSNNRIQSFTEVLYDYAFSDDRFVVTYLYEDTPISFSPDVVAASDLTLIHKGFTAQLLNKYVGKQFLDNTGNKDRVIPSYFVTDLRLGYQFSRDYLKNVGLNIMVNNLLNTLYSSNGYTWGYLFEGFHYQQNNYYPQAGTNYLLGLSLKF